MAESKHPWRFHRAGGLDQVFLESADDFRHIGELDPKVWVALACPVDGLEFDKDTLKLIDTDGDGRIRQPEVVEAVGFAVARLNDPGELVKCSGVLQLSAIKQDDEGKLITSAARRALAALGKPDAPSISVEEAVNSLGAVPKLKHNGDGVVPPASADDDATKAVIEDILKTVGGVADRSGDQGVDAGLLDAFFTELADFQQWWTQGQELSASVGEFPAGTDVPAAKAATDAVRAKIDDYFARCEVASFDERAIAGLDTLDSGYAAAAVNDMATGSKEVEALALQKIGPSRSLDLSSGLNPAWAARIAAFRAAAVVPLLGADKTAVTAAEWARVKNSLAPYESWLASAKGQKVAGLGIGRVEALLASDSKAAISALIASDLEPAPEIAALENLVRLVRYYRDLYKLLRNFINLGDFYDPTALAVFDAGRLYLDQRTCHLCIQVPNMGAHSAIAGASMMYIAYCNCTRPGGKSMTIAAAFTQGSSDFISVGRRGMFIDREGKDWDAQITKVIENPISLREAFFAPYKKVAKFIEDQITKFAASKDKAVTDQATAGVSSAAAAPAAKAEAFDIAKFAGIFAAIGLAIGAIGGALGAMLGVFFTLAWWQMPLAILGLLLVISGPSMLLAFLKLRKRALGPMLEGNAWAVNGRVRVNIPLGTALTKLKKLPEGSSLSLEDPYADKAAKRRRIVVAIVLFLAGAAWLLWVLHKNEVITLHFGL